MLTEFLIFVVALAWLRHFLKKRPDRFPPGPYGLPLVGYLPFLGRLPHKTITKLAQKYGDVYSIQLGMKTMVVISGYPTLRQALKEEEFSGRPDVLIDKYWASLGKDFNHGVIFSTGPLWVEQRRFMIRQLKDFGFGKQTMEEMVLDEVTECVDNMAKEVGHPITFDERFELAVVNGLWRLISGERFAQDDVRLHDMTETMTKQIAEANLTGGIAFLFPFLKKIMPNVLGMQKLAKSTGDLLAMTEKVTDEHMKTFKEETLRDITDSYIKEVRSTTDPNSSFYGSLGEDNIKVALLDLFGAGFETTSAALKWVGLYLISYPEIQKKIQDEVVKVLGDDRLPSLLNRPMMPYTEAFINEILRHTSFLPEAVLHCTTKDVEFKGFFIPKDTIIIPNTHSSNHDVAHWGDPDVFRPERFITPEGTCRNDDAFMLFSPGRRQCPGELLGRNSLFLFISAILQRFNLRAIPGAKLSFDARAPGINLHPKPYELILSFRKP